MGTVLPLGRPPGRLFWTARQPLQFAGVLARREEVGRPCETPSAPPRSRPHSGARGESRGSQNGVGAVFGAARSGSSDRRPGIFCQFFETLRLPISHWVVNRTSRAMSGIDPHGSPPETGSTPLRTLMRRSPTRFGLRHTPSRSPERANAINPSGFDRGCRRGRLGPGLRISGRTAVMDRGRVLGRGDGSWVTFEAILQIWAASVIIKGREILQAQPYPWKIWGPSSKTASRKGNLAERSLPRTRKPPSFNHHDLVPISHDLCFRPLAAARGRGRPPRLAGHTTRSPDR